MTIPDAMTFEEFVEFMEDLKQKVRKTFPSPLFEKEPLKRDFYSLQEFRDYYNTISVDEYLQKSIKKYGV